jgi:hypothetical protein
MRKAARTQTTWIHRIHTAGGASGSITMVVMFVVCLCCCRWTHDVMSSSYVKNSTKNNLKMRSMALLSDPPLRAPYHPEKEMVVCENLVAPWQKCGATMAKTWCHHGGIFKSNHSNYQPIQNWRKGINSIDFDLETVVLDTRY